ncbi:hypothetical protein [Acinetobacter sp. CAAS 2-6]|uniref:hypothetical protein n=1 Tax=Acinetobacter sp. CAAS 2-6 TaxID=3016358 RepID=UPI002DD6541F|nr:hypothetical protein [Acinetobacter sp. CAAS 2-6]
MSGNSKKPSPKVLIFASLGLLIPIFVVTMGFIAAKSDAENQKKYKQQHEEQLKRIAERERLKQQAASEAQQS